jgi:uncharacterized protein
MRKLRVSSIVGAGALCVVLSGTAGAAQNQTKATSGASAAQSKSPATSPITSPGAAQSATSTTGTTATIDPQKEADIRHLLDVVGTTALVQQIMNNMTQSLRPMMSNSLPPGEYRDTLIDLFFEKFRAKFDSKRMLDLAVARYDENFTDEEIRGLIDFYQTPLGKKVASQLPKITSEMQQDGQKMGERLGRASMTEVMLEHPELQKAMQEAAREAGAGSR